MNFTNQSIRSYLLRNLSKEEKRKLQQYSTEIIKGIKRGDDKAFDDFLNILDVKKCVNQITRTIYNKFDANVSVDVIKNELNILIYHFIKTNYRIYNQPNEIQMVLVSMYGWLGGKASKRIYNNLYPKIDEYLGCCDMMEYNALAEVELKIALQEILTEEEYKLFEDRYVENKTFTEIGKEMNLAESTIRNRHKLLLEKIKISLFN